MSRRQDIARLRAAFFRGISTYGFRTVEPPLLLPAEPFIRLSGESLKRRLFLTTNAQGQEMCLRPDFTLPIAMMHLEEGGGIRAQYAYCGSLFRQRSGEESDEFTQAGIESYGDEDRASADAAVVRLAVHFLVTEGLDRFTIRLGDVSITDRLLKAANLPATLHRRFTSGFVDTKHFRFEMDKLAEIVSEGMGTRDEEGRGALEGLFSLLRQGTPDQVKEVVEGLLTLTGASDIPGRTAHDIADRLIEKSREQTYGQLEPRQLDLLRAYFSIEGPVEEALAQIKALARQYDISLEPALSGFDKRLELLRSHGIATSTTLYSSEFYNRLTYYSGLVFEIDRADGQRGTPLAVGGRYDHLFKSIGGRHDTPSVGCAIWLDRVNEALS